MPRRDDRSSLPYGPRHWLIFAAGLGAIALGYIFLSIGPADSFSSLTIGPILLVLGYCVLIPVALLARLSRSDREQAEPEGRKKPKP
jgi:hypothetical protein